MARSRNIKPAFFQNEDLADLPFETRLLFIGLWTIADRCGRLEDRPRRIKGSLFPFDDIDADALLQQLADSPDRFIIRYEIDGQRYIQITNFEKHQNPHIKETVSVISAPDMHGTSIMQAPDMHGTSPADSLILIPDSCFPHTYSLNPASGNGAGDGKLPPTKKRDVGKYTAEFDAFWEKYPRQVAKKEAFKHWNTRKKDRCLDPEKILVAAETYANAVAFLQRAPDKIMHPSTFINGRWLNWLPPEGDEYLDARRTYAAMQKNVSARASAGFCVHIPSLEEIDVANPSLIGLFGNKPPALDVEAAIVNER